MGATWHSASGRVSVSRARGVGRGLGRSPAFRRALAVKQARCRRLRWRRHPPPRRVRLGSSPSRIAVARASWRSRLVVRRDVGFGPGRARRRARAPRESGAGSRTTHAVPVPLSPDDALASVRAATVVVAPHAAKTQLPFLRSSRRGSGVVVSLDGAGGDLRVLTAAHVACLAGPDNRVDVRASDAANAPTRVGSVVAVHPRLDLALTVALDGPSARAFRISRRRGNEARARRRGKKKTSSRRRSRRSRRRCLPSARASPRSGTLWAGPPRSGPRCGAGTTPPPACGASSSRRRGGVARRRRRFSGTDRDDETEKARVAAFALHTASVASGCSGGPLVSERGEVIGVHSFGDAFYGGARDVAVATPRALVQRLGAFGT